ncbi:hypothetical protein Q3G72_001899 [Acer saccharum]|nr:hypothetical protein Q3G72_001899 [Acer saccharum]
MRVKINGESDMIPLKFKKFWDEWNIRGVMLFSLSMQTFLILFAPQRKGTANKLIIMLLCQGNPPDAFTPSENSDLLAFWPPFLLLHLGGPDTITAFALEDNELWLRHLLGSYSRLLLLFTSSSKRFSKTS